MKNYLHKLMALLIATTFTMGAWAQTWTDITNGDGNTFTVKYSNPTDHDVFETWTNASSTTHAFDWNQTVTNIPDGIYELSANAMYRASFEYGTPTNCVLYATVGEEEYTTPIANFADYSAVEDRAQIATQMQNNDAYKSKIGNIIVENGEAKIGIKSIGELVFCNNGYWFVCKKSTFSFKNVTDAYFASLQAKVNGMLASAVENDAKAALAAALETYATATVENVKGLQAAIDNFMLTASEENPIDVTSYMANPSFEEGSTTYWYQDLGYTQGENRNVQQPAGWNLLYSSAKVGNTQYQSFMPQTDGAKDGNCLYVRHRWGDVLAVEDLRQSVQGLRAGKYQLTVSVKGGSNVTDPNTLTLTAGEETETATISEFDKANYKDYSVSVVKYDDKSSLDICYGLKQQYGEEQLYYIDDFRLTFLGTISLADVVAKYEAALAVAQATAAKSDKVELAVMAALNAVIASYGSVDKTDMALMQEAVDALDAAAAAVDNSIAAYGKVAAYLEKMGAVLAGTNVYTQEAYDEYYGDWLAGYEAGTLETATAATLNANTALGTGWRSSNNIDDILLSAWTIGGEQANNYDLALYVNTWSTEGNEDGSEFFTPFFEYWTGDGAVLGANTIQAKLTGLKAETLYSFTIRARVRNTNGQTKVAEGITMQVGEGTPVDISAGAQFSTTQFYIGNFTAVGETDAEGTLTATITVAANSNISWLSFYNAKYTEGEDLSGYIADYEFALNNAEKALDKDVPSPLGDALNATIDKYSAVDNEDKAALIEAKTALEDITAQVGEAVMPYAKCKDLIAACEGHLEFSKEVTAGSKVTLESAIASAMESAEDALTAAELNEVWAVLRDACFAYIANAVPTEGDMFDVTFCIENPSFETGDLTGWKVEKSANDTGVKPNSNGTYSMDACDGAYLFNTWQGTGIDVQQTVKELPAGEYTLKVVVASDADVQLDVTAGSKTVKHTCKGGGGVGNEVAVENIAHEGGDFLIKVATVSNSWFKADNFRLYCAGAEPEIFPAQSVKVGDVALVEGAATVESISTIDVIFDRPVVLAEGAGWATLTDRYGPTNLDVEVLAAEEGSSEYVVRFSVSQEFEGEFTAADEYTLNIPEGFIVGAEGANCINAAIAATITIEATPLKVTNVTVGEDVMEGLTAVATPDDMIKVNFDGKFYFQGMPSIIDAEGNDASEYFQFMSGMDVDGSNSYIFMAKDWEETAAPAGIYTITLAKASFLGMAEYKAPAEDIVLTVEIVAVSTGIQNISVGTDAVIYDLSGRRVEKAVKGIYIVNGKKVVK